MTKPTKAVAPSINEGTKAALEALALAEKNLVHSFSGLSKAITYARGEMFNRAVFAAHDFYMAHLSVADIEPGSVDAFDKLVRKALDPLKQVPVEGSDKAVLPKGLSNQIGLVSKGVMLIAGGYVFRQWALPDGSGNSATDKQQTPKQKPVLTCDWHRFARETKINNSGETGATVPHRRLVHQSGTGSIGDLFDFHIMNRKDWFTPTGERKRTPKETDKTTHLVDMIKQSTKASIDTLAGILRGQNAEPSKEMAKALDQLVDDAIGWKYRDSSEASIIAGVRDAVTLVSTFDASRVTDEASRKGLLNALSDLISACAEVSTKVETASTQAQRVEKIQAKGKGKKGKANAEPKLIEAQAA